MYPLSITAYRPVVWFGVCAIHGAALAAMAVNLKAAPDMVGGAPVIRLTLAPRASFDGANASRSSAASPAPRSTPTPRPLRNRVEKIPPLPMRQAVAPPSAAKPIVMTDRGAPASSNSAGQADSGAPARGHASVASEAGLTEGGGAPVIGAGAASNEDAYEAAVLAWIERHKRHPGGMAGIVTIRFTLDRRGKVRFSEVVSGSGISRVDHAALSQLGAAEPFPRPSPGASWRTRDFTVRIDFRSSPGAPNRL